MEVSYLVVTPTALAAVFYFGSGFSLRNDIPRIIFFIGISVLLHNFLFDRSTSSLGNYTLFLLAFSIAGFVVGKKTIFHLIFNILSLSYIYNQIFKTEIGGKEPGLKIHWAYVTFMAIIQLARNPDELRHFLTTFRKPMGPSSFFMSVFAACQDIAYNQSGVVGQILASVSLLIIILAIIILRPDNNEVFNLVTPAWVKNSIPNVTEKKKWHAYFNITFVALAIILFYLNI